MSTNDLLKSLYPISVRRDVCLKDYCRYKTGGNADFYGYDFDKNKYTISPFSSVDTIEEAKKLLNTQKIDDFIDDKVKNTLKNLR